MLKFNEDLSIDRMPLDVYDDILNELNNDNAWKTLAEYVSDKLGYSSTWVKSLETKASKGESPGQNLLVELNIRMCTVGVLSYLLEESNLTKVQSILHEPEILSIILQPNADANSDDLNIALGQRLCLSCKAVGLPPPSYQWYHEGSMLEGQDSQELNVTIKTISQKGCYQCKVYQKSHKGELVHETFSRPVYVDIMPTPVVIGIQPIGFLEVKEGESLVLECKADSYPYPQYQWYKDNSRLDYQTTNVLKIDKFAVKDEGKYYCHIFNDVSEIYTEQSNVLLELPRQKAVAKIALLIANENYDNQETLRTPKNDVAKVAKILNGLGFYTICLADLTLEQMKNAIKIFCDSLVEGAYGLFYFAGHGFKMQENYMLSVDAPTDYLRKDAICESELLSLGLKSDPALFVAILDMCQTIPPKECNPNIHKEVPPLHEYKGRKNLRNLLQAYSTSSYRPCYERKGKNYGFYATHLCKYLDENIPVTKVFEQVGKSIDTWLKGAERKQIPMFATTVTKPYRLTDRISQGKTPEAIKTLENLMSFPNSTIKIIFQQTGIQCQATISQHIKPYLNIVQISLTELDDKWESNFYNSVNAKRNNLFQSDTKNKCWLHNPQNNKGPLVISLLENKVHVGATLLEINEFIPTLLKKLIKGFYKNIVFLLNLYITCLLLNCT